MRGHRELNYHPYVQKDNVRTYPNDLSKDRKVLSGRMLTRDG
jgi:hypothetical protein